MFFISKIKSAFFNLCHLFIYFKDLLILFFACGGSLLLLPDFLWLWLVGSLLPCGAQASL